MTNHSAKAIFEHAYHQRVAQAQTAVFAKAVPAKDRRENGLNKTERRYLESVLTPKQMAGEIVRVWTQQFTFLLGNNLRYTPDFVCMAADRSLYAIDVKGKKVRTKKSGERYDTPYVEEDARVKMLAFAEMYPFPLVCVYPMSGGGWHEDIW